MEKLITKEKLFDVMLEWERAHRSNKTRTYQETRQMAIEQVVEESTDYLWQELNKE